MALVSTQVEMTSFLLWLPSPHLGRKWSLRPRWGEGLGVVWRTEDTLVSMGKILELKKVATFYVVKHSAKLHSCWKS